MRPRCWILCCVLFCAHASLIAQNQMGSQETGLPATCEPKIAAIRHYSLGSKEREGAIRRSLLIRENASCFSQLLATDDKFKSDFQAAFQQTERTNYMNFLKALEARRTDKQAGSSTGSGGTTNLVSKGYTAQALSLASEYGALTESTSKQVVTVQGSLGGIGAALTRAGLFEYCPSHEAPTPGACLHQKELGFLRRVSFGVSFDTSRSTQTLSGTSNGSQSGNAQPVTFTARGHDISAVTARFILINKRDDTSDQFKKQWEDKLSPKSGNADTRAFLDTAATNLLASLKTLLNGLESSPGNDYSDWLERSVKDLTQASEEDLEEKWRKHASEFLGMAKGLDPSLVRDVADLVQKTSNYRLEEEAFVSSMADMPVLTLEYNNNRPTGQISTSTVRFIFDKGIGANWSVTANGAFSIYDSHPSSSIPGASRLRDVQAGVQVDRKLQSLAFLGAPTLSGTYYFQYQNSPSILNVDPSMPLPGITLTGLPSNATQVFVQKGNISIAQLKLTLGTGKSSVRIPLAISYSNRTELITKPAWRAQIGISYDFDSLFAPSGNGSSASKTTSP
jgi:hypothetical protein